MSVEVAPRFDFGAAALLKASAEVGVSVGCFGFQCALVSLHSVVMSTAARGLAFCPLSFHSFAVSMLWCAVLCAGVFL